MSKITKAKSAPPRKSKKQNSLKFALLVIGSIFSIMIHYPDDKPIFTFAYYILIIVNFGLELFLHFIKNILEISKFDLPMDLLLIPFLEELCFRNWLLEVDDEYRIVATIASSFLFAILHIIGKEGKFLEFFIFGIIYAIGLFLTGSFIGGVLLHMLSNTTIYIMATISMIGKGYTLKKLFL